MDDKIIGHIDMDAFFASVEEVDKPWLKGLPIVVGSDPKGGKGRGVVSTANYLAREYGIHSALPITKAWEYSENARKRGRKRAIFISGSSNKYKKASDEVFGVVGSYVETLERTSVDEGYFDLSYLRTYKKAKETVCKIKNEILKRTKLTCSVGVGPNKMIAKIASDFNKPNGLTLVEEEKVLDFLAPLNVGKIPGIGPKTQARLRNINVETVEDARKYSWEELYKIFGSHGISIFQKIYGSGSTRFGEEEIRKSIGQHETFYRDTNDMEYITHTLKKMSSKIIGSLKAEGFFGAKTLVITVRFKDFETKNRSITGEDYIYTEEKMNTRAMKLILPFFDYTENPNKKLIRMVGLRAEKLI
jgi:DNA polymerase IV (DinB-like DNA polymerase)